MRPLRGSEECPPPGVKNRSRSRRSAGPLPLVSRSRRSRRRPSVQKAPAAKSAPKGNRAASPKAAGKGNPSVTAVVPVARHSDGRVHVLSLSFVRDGDEFLARMETDGSQITELKNRFLDQLLTLRRERARGPARVRPGALARATPVLAGARGAVPLRDGRCDGARRHRRSRPPPPHDSIGSSSGTVARARRGSLRSVGTAGACPTTR